jgi:hypothetical protein
MELHAEQAPRRIGESGDRRVMTVRENLPSLGETKSSCRRGSSTPRVESFVGKAVKQIGIAVDDQIGRTILAAIGAAGFAAKVEIEDTHAVADAEKRHRQLKQLGLTFGALS